MLLQNSTRRHAYLNSFSTVPQSAEYGINRFSDFSQKEFRGRLKFCHISKMKCIWLFCILRIWITEHLTPVDDLAESAQSLFSCNLLSRIDLELYLLSTDLFLRAHADRAPLFSGLKTEGLPAIFDWRDKAVVAPVQNQEAVRCTQEDDRYTGY